MKDLIYYLLCLTAVAATALSQYFLAGIFLAIYFLLRYRTLIPSDLNR